VHPKKPVTQLKVRVTRQTGETVLEGEAWCYTFDGNAGADRRFTGRSGGHEGIGGSQGDQEITE
jgi:hypothetical protein